MVNFVFLSVDTDAQLSASISGLKSDQCIPVKLKKPLKLCFPLIAQTPNPTLHYTGFNRKNRTVKHVAPCCLLCKTCFFLSSVRVKTRQRHISNHCFVLFLCDDYDITWLAYSNIMQRSRN